LILFFALYITYFYFTLNGCIEYTCRSIQKQIIIIGKGTE
jgi:hypothetical protein